MIKRNSLTNQSVRDQYVPLSPQIADTHHIPHSQVYDQIPLDKPNNAIYASILDQDSSIRPISKRSMFKRLTQCYKVIDQPQTEQPEHVDNEPLGLMLMLGSLALFTVTMVLNRVIQQTYTTSAAEMFMYSSIVQVAISEVVRNKIYGESLEPLLENKHACRLVLVRQCFSVTGWISLTYVAAFLPLGFIQLTQNTIPVITAVIAFFALGERVSHLESIALVICFIVVASAGSVTSGIFGESTHSFRLLYIMLCCVSVFGFAIINVIGRLLKGIHFTVLCTAQFTLNVLFSMLVVMCSGGLTHPLYIFDSMWLAVIALGASRTFSTQLFVRATQIAKSQRIASLNYCQALFGYSIDVLFYGYMLSGIEVLAVLVIIGTGAVVFIQSRNDHAAEQSKSKLHDLEQPLIRK